MRRQEQTYLLERCGTSRPGTGIKILYLAELVPFDGAAGAVDSEIMRINIAGFDPMAQLTVTEISASTAIFTF